MDLHLLPIFTKMQEITVYHIFNLWKKLMVSDLVNFFEDGTKYENIL